MLHFFGWLTAAFFFFYAWVLRVSPSVMVEELMRDFAVGAAAVGNLSAFYFYGYAGLQVPIGVMMDRFGPRRLVTVAAAVCALGCVLSALGPTFEWVAIGRFVIGGSAAFSLVGAMAVAGLWFPAHRFALLSGLAMMLGMAGGVFGQAPLRLMVETLQWRNALLLLAAGGLVLAVAAWCTIRDRSLRTGGSKRPRSLAGLVSVLGNRQSWLIAIAGLGTTGPLLGFAGLWGVPYLTATHGVEPAVAAAVTSTLFIGWGCGAPAFGWISDHIGLRRPPFIAGMLLCTVTMAILLVPGLSLPVIAVLCFACGFGGSAQIVGFAAAREHNGDSFSGTAIGFVNGMVTGAGALYQPLLGWLLDRAWDGSMSAGAKVYSPDAYRLALSVLVVGGAAGLVCTLAMRETYCRTAR